MNYLYPILSVLIVSLIAFVGLWAFAINVKRLKQIVFYLVSFSAGALLGNTFFHLLPEIAEEIGFTVQVSLLVLFGIFLSFVIEKLLWRHCHLHDCKHKEHHHKKIQPFAYINLLGDGVHNFIDGLIIGASYLISIPVGMATTLAVVLHEIPQEIGDFGVLVHAGFERGKALFYNFLSALAALLGVIIALALAESVHITDYLIPFAAGNFIYLACTDLLPELHKQSELKESIWQILFFLVGILIMFFLTFFVGEPVH
ncbi:ZIP family metal transporter [Candidatus Woesearchaeota archaeon CG10_big_fil_rev_8_21_14_0_10_37_12]|nr:MAG: ZIP family metal transporter [Candidatus Woesearchaeota archaeon CG10_big_fil_rev_8_21_14_0_10_37_12]